MTTQRDRHLDWLLDLTGVPTAPGREDRVVAWVERWAKARKGLRVSRDTAGNVLIEQTRRSRRPRLLFTAHLDHPGFVVRKIEDERLLRLEFRGGVRDPYFEDAAIEVLDRDDRWQRAVVTEMAAPKEGFKQVTARLSRPTATIEPGAIGRWRLAGRGASPVVHDGLLHAPACDDLSAAAAALAALDVLRGRKAAGHVGVLLTLAEEVGFIGAIAACRDGTVRASDRLVCLEASRSYAESPLRAGPILRVGDRLSVFSPALTNRIGVLLSEHAERRPDLRWQRKLMPGGVCEATTFASYGFESTCVCLPLDNIHNMRDIDAVLDGRRPARVGPEIVAVDDYHGLIDLLVLCGQELGDDDTPALRPRMERLYAKNGWVLGTHG